MGKSPSLASLEGLIIIIELLMVYSYLLLFIYYMDEAIKIVSL